ncbi:unnamed protein product [Polarella glacialis]|uniref:Uncharacterized protein n=1 Tax=Polarella glacialis TaxID=89957 RepID=A0A813GVP6_POLGL|nr:unnamed protein product [Polarella glacialis]
MCMSRRKARQGPCRKAARALRGGTGPSRPSRRLAPTAHEGSRRHKQQRTKFKAFIVDRAFLRVEADDQIEAIIPGDLWHLAKDKPESLPCLFRHGVQAPHSSDFDVGSGPSGTEVAVRGSSVSA